MYVGLRIIVLIMNARRLSQFPEQLQNNTFMSFVYHCIHYENLSLGQTPRRLPYHSSIWKEK